MNESMNQLTNDEVRKAVDVALDVIGVGGARGVAWHIMDTEAEKVTSDIEGDKAKTLAELAVIRMILDSLESAYKEELDIANGGDDPTYRLR